MICPVDELVNEYAIFRSSASKISELRASQKKLTQQLGALRKAQRGDTETDNAEAKAQIDSLTDQSKAMRLQINVAETRQRETEQRLWTLARQIPNATHPEAPVGPESAAATVALRGEKATFDGFTPRNHVDVATDLRLVDFQAGAKVSGRSFYCINLHKN